MNDVIRPSASSGDSVDADAKDHGAVCDEALVALAEELFLELDASEAADADG